MPEKFYVTTPIYYVNARPHIGHAYTTIVADVLARRARAAGHDTWFLTGTDEHGQKIERSAAAAGIPPQQFTDQVSLEFRNLWNRMGLTFDQFIRTTDQAHKRGVQQLFSTLYDNKKIYLSSYTGQYSIGEEMFVEGPPGTIGPDGKPTETVTEENFFFRLSDYQLPLLNLIESNELKITPEARRNEVLSFLRGPVPKDLFPAPNAGAPGLASEIWVPAFPQILTTSAGNPYVPGALRDLSVSRSSFTWGIPVPEPAASAAKEKHVIYVWLDALANYMTAVGYGDPTRTADFEKWWPADLHIMAKEITRQHCIYWPAFLLAAGLPLPRAITAHGWLLFEDSKMSKSKGNIVRTETILDAFGQLCPPPPTGSNADTPASCSSTPPLLSSRSEAQGAAYLSEPPQPTKQDRDLFAADILRYFLLREIPFGQDGSFSFEALITRYNADLANGYGNLVSRTLNMIQTYREGKVPGLCKAEGHASTTPSLVLGTEFLVFFEAVNHPMQEDFDLRQIAQEIMIHVANADRFVTLTAPWKIAKEMDQLSQRALDNVLATAWDSLRFLTALFHPILPYATANVWRQLGLGNIADADLTNLQWGGLQPGTKLGPLSPIFPRADKKLAEVMTQMEHEKNAPTGANAAHDTTSSETTEFKEAPIASKPPLSKFVDETTGRPAAHLTSFDPAAGPRTSHLAEPNPGRQVAASTAPTTEREGTPSHTEANASGIFAPQTETQITIDDFAKVELRVAQVLVCERIPKADKLLRLEVDLGPLGKRQILSGIAEWYTPEDLIGRRIVVITNLAPRKMRGLESHGMLLAASAEGGKPFLATFDISAAEALPLGSRLK